MATTYDTIYTEFITNCLTEGINLPQTDEKIYNTIHSAIRNYNNRMQESITWDDVTEVVSVDLDNTQLLLMSHNLRLAFLKNQLVFFTSCWQPFEREIGLRNFQTQVKSLEKQISDEESNIEKIIQNSATDIV